MIPHSISLQFIIIIAWAAAAGRKPFLGRQRFVKPINGQEVCKWITDWHLRPSQGRSKCPLETVAWSLINSEHGADEGGECAAAAAAPHRRTS